jgi:excisionase family DNA binding protein
VPSAAPVKPQRNTPHGAPQAQTINELSHPTSIKPLLVAEQVEPILQVSRQRIYEMARCGIFPAGVVVRLGRQVRFDEDALREWLRTGGTPAE